MFGAYENIYNSLIPFIDDGSPLGFLFVRLISNTLSLLVALVPVFIVLFITHLIVNFWRA